MYLCKFPLSLRQNCPYIDAKEIRLVDLNKTLVIEALSSLLTLFVHIFTCPCVAIPYQYHFVTCTQGTSYTYIKALAFYVPCVQVTKWSLTLLIMPIHATNHRCS